YKDERNQDERYRDERNRDERYKDDPCNQGPSRTNDPKVWPVFSSQQDESNLERRIASDRDRMPPKCNEKWLKQGDQPVRPLSAEEEARFDLAQIGHLAMTTTRLTRELIKAVNLLNVNEMDGTCTTTDVYMRERSPGCMTTRHTLMMNIAKMVECKGNTTQVTAYNVALKRISMISSRASTVLTQIKIILSRGQRSVYPLEECKPKHSK
ncbi:unnamed protein product, partial [Owenia fusiformis]